MKEIKLFDYQEDMKERIEKAFESHQSVMVQMPTGTGKTILLAEVVKSEKLKGKIHVCGLWCIGVNWWNR